MYQYRAICADNIEIELVGLIDKTTGKIDMPWIEFKTIKDKEYPDQDLSWDNPDFIFVKFYKFLKRWQKKELKKKDHKKYEDVWEILNEKVVEELILMIELALEQGWYEPKTE